MKDCHAVIDIGSSVCKVVVGRFLPNSNLEIIGTGCSPTQGVKTGVIVNIEGVAQSISEAVREAELMSGIMIEEVMCNISGKSLQSDNSKGVIAITNKDRLVGTSEVLRAIEAAQNIRIPSDHEIIHVLSRDFCLDDQNGIRDPVGMNGIRLEVKVHIVTATLTTLANLSKSLQSIGIYLQGVVMNSLASAEALIKQPEKEMGIAMIDIGGGVSDVIMYNEGGVAFSTVIPIGGNHITQDLSIGLKVPLEIAEFIKKNYACASVGMVDPTEKIELPSPNGQRQSRQVSRQLITEIVEARLREIFELIDAKLQKSELKNFMSAGVVLCGGTALTEGIAELAEEILGLNVMLRIPTDVEGFIDRVNSPDFACSIGLLQYIQKLNYKNFNSNNENNTKKANKTKTNNIIEKIKSWLVENI